MRAAPGPAGVLRKEVRGAGTVGGACKWLSGGAGPALLRKATGAHAELCFGCRAEPTGSDPWPGSRSTQIMIRNQPPIRCMPPHRRGARGLVAQRLRFTRSLGGGPSEASSLRGRPAAAAAGPALTRRQGLRAGVGWGGVGGCSRLAAARPPADRSRQGPCPLQALLCLFVIAGGRRR